MLPNGAKIVKIGRVVVELLVVEDVHQLSNSVLAIGADKVCPTLF